ncbi:SPFH domain-containing protein [Actinobacillus equuli]|nr:SPFH domain-containing protein [Actinobacillus equuli]
MEVKRVAEVKQAEIAKDVEIVKADQENVRKKLRRKRIKMR